MSREAKTVFQFARVCHQLLNRTDLSAARVWIRITKEAVRRKSHAVAQAPAKNVADWNAPRLPENIQTRKLDSREDLRAIVVKRCSGICDEEADFLKTRGIVPNEITFHRTEYTFRRFAASTHFAETN